MRPRSALVAATITFGLMPLGLVAQVPAKQAAASNRLAALKPLAAPQGVQAVWTPKGVSLTWQAVTEATIYAVVRGPDAVTAGTEIAQVPAGQLSHLDAGFSSPAAYQIVAIAADGRRGASAIVPFAPPATRTVIKGVGQQAPVVPPVVTSVGTLVNGVWVTDVGVPTKVTGSGFDGSISVSLVPARTLTTGQLVPDPSGGPPVTVAPSAISTTTFEFTPQIPIPSGQNRPYLFVVAKGSVADSGDLKLLVSGPRVVRKITSVRELKIRAGNLLEITGIGLEQVEGAYFGVGLPGSVTNPLHSIWSATPTTVTIRTAAGCNQSGLLMLKGPATGGASPDLITGDQPITVACYPGTPTGVVTGTENRATPLPVVSGGSITITGTSLGAVSRVLDGQNNPLPFTYSNAGGAERLTVTLPVSGPRTLSFKLDNPLTGPAAIGMVSGLVEIMGAPAFTSISPAWAEAGMRVTVQGQRLSYGTPPQVRVGGVAAQVVTATPTSLEFIVGPGTTTGPIEVQTAGGTTPLTGPFTMGNGAQHPGFMVVAGPSVVTGVVLPRPTLAFGDTVVVQGQNLARLMGVCVVVASSPQGAPMMTRVGGNMNPLSNTTMAVVWTNSFPPVSRAPVQLLASTTGNPLSGPYACQASSVPFLWP